MKRRTAVRLDTAGSIALVLALLAAVLVGSYLSTPRTTGLSGAWSATAFAGDVVAGRALVGGGNAVLDLRTGKSVRLGSVVGGTAFYADSRLMVVKGGRVDSVALDASARWTWRAPGGHTVLPLAASQGSTLVADCPAKASARCRFVGLDPAGRQGWTAADADRPVDPPRGSLPRVHAQRVAGGGVLLTDPSSGRTSLQPGASFVAVPDGPVVVPVQQGGQCVVSLYDAPDPRWARVLGPCPGGRLPQVAVADGVVALTWPGRTERLAAATGAAATAPPPRGSVKGALATADPVVATREVSHPRTGNLLQWHDRHLLQLRDARSGDVRAQLVTDAPVDLLVLEPRAVVVREGGRIVRYTFDD